MDNAECHKSIEALNYCLENGIVILTLPPHTTDKLQPLDVSIYASFKSQLKQIQNSFRQMNPNVHISIQMMPEMASKASSDRSRFHLLPLQSHLKQLQVHLLHLKFNWNSTLFSTLGPYRLHVSYLLLKFNRNSTLFSRLWPYRLHISVLGLLRPKPVSTPSLNAIIGYFAKTLPVLQKGTRSAPCSSAAPANSSA